MKHSTKQQIARWGSVGSLAILVVLFTQCGAPVKNSSSADSNNVEVSNPGGLMQAEAEAPTVGVKDADRILYTMAAVTGIPADNNNIRNAFTNLKAQLPANSRLESLSENQMVTVTKLAAEFCNLLVGNNTFTAQRTAIWPSTNFGAAWMTALPNTVNKDQRGDFVAKTLENFWGVNVLDQQVYDESFDAMMDLMSIMLEGDPFANPPITAAANNATSTLNATKAVCTAALSSAPVWMN